MLPSAESSAVAGRQARICVLSGKLFAMYARISSWPFGTVPWAVTCTPAVSNHDTHPSMRRVAKSELKSRSACMTDSRSSAVVIVSAYGVPPEEEALHAVRTARTSSGRMVGPGRAMRGTLGGSAVDFKNGRKYYHHEPDCITTEAQRHRERRPARPLQVAVLCASVVMQSGSLR